MPTRGQIQRRRLVALLLLLGVVALTVAVVTGVFDGGGGSPPTDSDPAVDSPQAVAAQIADDYCGASGKTGRSRMVGAMLIVRWDGMRNKTLDNLVKRGRIAGVIVFPVVDSPTLAAESARLQRIAERADIPPLVVSIDQEGGPVKRFAAAPPTISPRELADGNASAGKSRRQGARTGAFLHEAGVNVDFAPVLDVPETTDSLTYSRAFGDRPGPVSRRGIAFADGLADENVIATAKHFPGLGRTSINTDLTTATITASAADLTSDVEPFRRAFDAGVPIVMTANATYTALDPKHPASLSAKVTTKLLRDDLGFDGVAVTDDLGAGGITANYTLLRAAVLAARAGNDWLLFAGTMQPAVDKTLKQSIQAGRLDSDAIRASCTRSVALRESIGFGQGDNGA